jgi:hypothetical protein
MLIWLIFQVSSLFIGQGARGGGGGVGFYIKDNLNCKILDLCPYIDSQFENIAIETTICHKKYIL